MNCPLCLSNSVFFHNYRHVDYFRCDGCSSVFVDPSNYLNSDEEKSRYLEHNNDVYDPGYRAFVQPIVDVVLSKFKVEHKGLDFGAGTGPVISKMLQEKGYNIDCFDPFFCNNQDLLTQKFDYIALCEVIEHFHNPRKEFEQLRNMLNSNGELICKTDILTDDINFKKWYYKDDPTHVFFYHLKAFDYIMKEFGFSDVIIDKRLIRFLA